MLTIRPFCNTDPPLLLELWKKSRLHDSQARLIPLSMNVLLMQTLGPPFYERRSIMLAFEKEKPVGYVHATPGPTPDGSTLSDQIGQICFLALDPEATEPVRVGKALLKTSEEFLTGLGIKDIFGGSPRPCAPFYVGFFGASEPLGFFDSELLPIQVFEESGYQVLKNTVRFHFELQDFEPQVTMTSVEQMDKLDVLINHLPMPKTWWEACSFAHFSWIESMAKLRDSGRTVARIRVRVTRSDSDESRFSSDKECHAGLMDVRVLPDFHRQGVAAFTLGETLRYLANRCDVRSIEAHIADDTATMISLLRSLHWNETDHGKVFRKLFN